jgi:hypothetical protein
MMEKRRAAWSVQVSHKAPRQFEMEGSGNNRATGCQLRHANPARPARGRVARFYTAHLAAYAERIDKRQKRNKNDDLPKNSKFGTVYA